MYDELFEPARTRNTSNLADALGSLRQVTPPRLEDQAYGVGGVFNVTSYFESLRKELDRIEREWEDL
jgi:hypothetical protein